MSADRGHGQFVEQIERHRGILFKVANAYCPHAADRDDLVAEMVAQLWASYPRFDGRAAFSSWMYRIAVNVAIAAFRAERRRLRVVPAEKRLLEDVAAPAEPEPNERLTLLRELVDRLDPLDKALMLLYLDDRPQAEIAAILGISESNVATKVGRIKERLRRTAAGVTR
jgi:RNA polymerase sigma-70 factor, ECF subfamily